MWSCGVLADAYRSGEGVEKDKAKAARLYKKACDGGAKRCDEVKK